MAIDKAAGAARLNDERARLDRIMARAAPAAGCGPAIPVAPARGAQVSVTANAMVPDPADATGWKAVEMGWRGFRAARSADIFDDLARRAAARKDKDGNPGVSPFTKGQVSVARLYRDLVERREAGGMKCASLEVRAGSGSSAGGEFIDAFIAEGERIAWLRERIGRGVAMPIRRVRPSDRGGDGARIIMDRALVDSICLYGKTFDQVLRAHGWAKSGQNMAALKASLAACLDRMQGKQLSREKKPS